MVNLRIGIVEHGIKTLLENQIKSVKWKWLREVKSYGGEFDDDVQVIIKSFPAIWVTFQGSGKPKKTSHNKTEYPLTLVVMVGARSLRNEETRRQGTIANIGTYDMLSFVQELLIGSNLSSVGVKGLEPLELGRTQTVFNTKTQSSSISVLSQEFTTQYTITASDRDREEAETDAYLERINIDYNVDQLAVKASDLVELNKD